jgi:hypothetical protein
MKNKTIKLFCLIFTIFFVKNSFTGGCASMGGCASCDNSLDTNYTCASVGEKPSLTTEEVSEVIDSILSTYEPRVLTPEELASVYEDVTYAAYARLGHIPVNIEIGSEPQDFVADIASKKKDFLKSARPAGGLNPQLRSFMDQGHATMGGTSLVGKTIYPTAPAPTLLEEYKLSAANYIHLAYVSQSDIPEYLRYFSQSELLHAQSAMRDLLKTFRSDAIFCKMMRCFKNIGTFKRVGRDSRRWYKYWSWCRYHHAIENFANHIIEVADKVLYEKRYEERQIKGKIAQNIKYAAAAKESCELMNRMANDTEELQNLKEYIQAQQNHFSKREFSKKHKLSTVAICQIEQCQYELQSGLNPPADGDNSRFPTCKKRLLAVIETIRTDGALEKKSYEVDGESKDLFANEIQHQIYQEAATCLDESVRIKNEFPDSDNVAKITDIVGDTVGHAIECSNQHEYIRSFDLIDLAANITYVLGRAIEGFALGGQDVNNFLSMKNSQEVLDASTTFWSSVSYFLEKVRAQPVRESIGDCAQCLSRKFVQASGIIVGVLGIAIAVETGAAVATGIASAVAAKNLLEPFAVKIAIDGSAILERTTPYWTSVSQAVVTSLNQVAQSLYGLSNTVNNLYFAMQGDGNGRVDGGDRDSQALDSATSDELIQLSEVRFGHTFSTHGQGNTHFLIKRAQGSGKPQGQFLDDQRAAKFILDNFEKTKNGTVDIEIPANFPARVIKPDGSFVSATHVRIVPSGNYIKTAYPIIL